ncbi:MAG: ComF family protein [Alphaproteobacteria bacterium]|nr:ComF family protein [Alphaproteobacteria bacterium]
MASLWRRAGRTALDLFYPPLCIICREPVGDPNGLCPSCWSTLHFLEGAACGICGLPFEVDPGGEMLCAACLAHPPAFDRARAILRYDDASKGPVLALKHADRLDLVPAFGRWLDRVGRDLLAHSDVIVPVPLHRLRLWTRRYNQSAEIARALGRACGKTVDPLLLSRRRATPSQGKMPSAAARRTNVRGAFAVPAERARDVSGRRILLVDDVMTTGATADACAKAFKRAGADKVFVLALARVVRA